MLEHSSTDPGDARLFLIELFDHDEQSPVVSRVCQTIDEGAVAFEAFVSR